MEDEHVGHQHTTEVEEHEQDTPLMGGKEGNMANTAEVAVERRRPWGKMCKSIATTTAAVDEATLCCHRQQTGNQKWQHVNTATNGENCCDRQETMHCCRHQMSAATRGGSNGREAKMAAIDKIHWQRYKQVKVAEDKRTPTTAAIKNKRQM